MDLWNGVLSSDLMRDRKLMMPTHDNHTDDVNQEENQVRIVQICKSVHTAKLELECVVAPV